MVLLGNVSRSKGKMGNSPFHGFVYYQTNFQQCSSGQSLLKPCTRAAIDMYRHIK